MTEARQIPLTNGGFALVDAADFGWLTGYTWYHSGRGYALQSSKRPGKNSGAAMHRIIMNPPKGTVADHVNGDRLDNRRCNLRIVDYLQNAQNRGKNVNSRSKYKGVCWKVENNKWQARIRVNGKQHHIGLYQTEEDAARAYNAAAILNHGDYSRLNIIPGDPAPCKPDECPVCHLRTTEPVSLEECALAAQKGFPVVHTGADEKGDWCVRPLEIEVFKRTAKAVLDAAGVRYVD